MSILFENVVTDTNPLPVKTIYEYTTKWDDDVDFDKGTYTDTEVTGTEASAKVQLEESAENDDDIPYTTESNYTLSDGAKLEVNGAGRLKSLAGDNEDYPFTTPSNYTYDSAIVDVTGGKAQLKATAYNSETTAYASYDSDIDLDHSDGTATGIAVGGASITSGKLNCTGDAVKYVSYSGVDNIGSLQTGCIRFKYTPNYSSGPPSWYTMFELQHASGSNYNEVYLSHTNISGGQIYIQIRGSGGGIVGGYLGVWTVTSGVEYEIEVNWDVTTGETRVFINGAQFGATKTNTGTITQLDFFKIGSNFNASEKMNAYFNDVKIFNAVQHTTNYTPSDNYYSQLAPDIITDDGFIFDAPLNTFTETITTPASTGIKYQISVDNGTTWKWYDSGWTTITGSQTDLWYYNNESNVASTIHTNIGSLGSSGTLKVRAFLYSSNVQATPLLDNIFIAETSSYSTDDNLYIDTKDAIHIAPTVLFSWLTATLTSTIPASTDIKIMLSVDGRTSWLVFDGGWIAPADATLRSSASTISDVQNNISTLPLGDKTLDVRVFIYSSDNNATPQFDNFNAVGDTGYAESGTYESNEYNSAYLSQDWNDISFSVTTPTGSTAIIKARAGNYSGSLGSYGSALTNGEETDLIGQYIQWQIEMTGDGTVTPSIDWLSLLYKITNTRELSP